MSCNSGLGCDIKTHTCVTPCGGTGQACCDGPETRATKWTADGKLYSPNTYNMKEMCVGGACNAATHACFGCGTVDGGACCPPDAAQATARCFGHNMSCGFTDAFATRGVCHACGIVNRAPCESGCDPDLGIRNHLCNVCGAQGQLPCDAGCNSGLETARGFCSQCGRVGQPACDRGCNAGSQAINGICTACGQNGQASCGGNCANGLVPVNGVCRPCGGNGQIACSGHRCNYPLKIANGVCRQCGAAGQIPCDSGCTSPLISVNGVCVVKDQTQPQACSPLNASCVPPTQPGTHCCQQSGAPLSCVFQTCKACVPHGGVCQLHGTQICCAYNDTCKLDPASGEAVCDIPDGPNP